MNFPARFFAAFCVSLVHRTVKCLKKLLGNLSVVASQNSFYTLCNAPNIPFQTLDHIPPDPMPHTAMHLFNCTYATSVVFFCFFVFCFFQPKRERLLISMATRSEEITNTEKRMNRVEDQVCLRAVMFGSLLFLWHSPRI